MDLNAIISTYSSEKNCLRDTRQTKVERGKLRQKPPAKMQNTLLKKQLDLSLGIKGAKLTQFGLFLKSYEP